MGAKRASGVGGVAVIDEPMPTREEWIVRELLALRRPLFAVLDAARDPLVLARISHCSEQHQSLYEGAQGDQLAAVAPYLLALPDGSSALPEIVRDGWGRSWGVYLTTVQPFAEVRKHLRRFLMVETDGGSPLYFRYYDPRVLRPFLPSCSRPEAIGFFGAIDSFLMEGDDPDTLLQFDHLDGLVRRRERRSGDGRPIGETPS